MFSIDCPVLGTEVTIWRDQITGFQCTSHGDAAEFRCECGAHAVCVQGETPWRGRLLYHASDLPLARPA